MKRVLLSLLMTVAFTTLRAADGKEGKGEAKAHSFKDLDANKDGKVSEEEFKASLPEKAGKKGGGGEKRLEIFRAADKDADGSLTEAEYKDVRKAMADAKKGEEKKKEDKKKKDK